MLALLPLDDRPCNRRFPAQLAAIGGSDLVVPPRELLGRFNTPGDPAALHNWLQNLPAVEALIVSVDMLAYGGLVASRRTQTSPAQALERLEILKNWRRERPQTPIYAFNILMRLAITMDSDAAVPHYYNVMRYARLADEAARFKSDYLREQLESVKAEIPPEVLEEYLGARARNHAVNLQMVDWLADGVFDFLLITQEDCTEFGLHRSEQEELAARVWKRGVADQFSLHPGADEAALTLLARHWNSGVRLRLHWSSDEDAKRIAPFEDVPYDTSLASHIAAMRGEIVEDESQNADFEFFVNAPVGGSQKDEKEEAKTTRREKIAAFAEKIAASVANGAQVAVCDVAFPNGADDVLMGELEKRAILGRLAAFGGWNTAGNTTGTVLAQCAALWSAQHRVSGVESPGALPHSALRAPQSSLQLNRQFVFERLLDDWCYQTRVRARVEAMARENGVSPLRMNGNAGPIEALTRRELRSFAHVLASRHFGAEMEKLEVALPWGRTFEVEIGAKLG